MFSEDYGPLGSPGTGPPRAGPGRQNPGASHPAVVSALIDLLVLKNHTMAGVTLSLKNHFGSTPRKGEGHELRNAWMQNQEEETREEEVRKLLGP